MVAKPEVLLVSPPSWQSKSILIFLVKCAVGMDHVRVHPKFLHSNATSHKWALGGKLCVFVWMVNHFGDMTFSPKVIKSS